MRHGRVGQVFLVVGMLGGILLRGGSVAAETIDAQSAIVEVTVFPDRALVTRRADVKLSQGVHAIRLAQLPGTIEPNSVSARGEGRAKVKLFGAKLVTTQLEAAQPARAKDLEEQIEQLNDQARQLQAKKEVVRQEREFLMSIKAASSEQIGKEIITKQPSVADVSSLLALLDRELTAAYQKDQQADIELRDIAEALDRLNRELAQLRGEWYKQETAVLVDLEAETPGAFTLEVSYRLPGATWQPTYEARAGSQASEVQLTTYGIIRQRTGEDWNNVRLSLSTAKPAIGGRMPELQPWYLRKQEAVAFNMLRMREDRAAKMALGAAGAPAAQEESAVLDKDEYERKEKAELAQASAQTQGPAVVFTLPKPETIAADWQPRKAAVSNLPFPASLAYETTPRLSPYAYLRAKVRNGSELVLLPGDAQVFLDGAFVATSSLKLVGPGEEFDLFLGIDERIRVERKQLKAKVDVSILPGLHGRMKTIDYEYLTTIQNFRSVPSHLTVIDQIPVSQHDDITVEQVVFEPKPTEEDREKPGVSKWAFELAAGEKKTLRQSYRVKHPVDFPLEGF